MLDKKTNKIDFCSIWLAFDKPLTLEETSILEVLNKLAKEIHGEFGFFTCNIAEQVEILKEI